MKIEVYSDGSGTTKVTPGGYGWVIVRDGVKLTEGSGYMPLATNNDAELQAAIEGLAEADKIIAATFMEEFKNDLIEVSLVSDSQIILNWANGRYQFKQEDKMDKYNDLRGYMKLLDVKTRWVHGHSGDEHNERCDQLAHLARLQIKEDIC